MKIRKTLRKIIAFVLSLVLALSTLVVNDEMLGKKTARAASQGYTVTVNFYDHDKSTPTNAKDPELENGKYYILVEAKNDFMNWTTYAFKQCNFDPEKSSISFNFSPSDFYCDMYNGTTFTGKNNNGWKGYYDTAQGYSMTSQNAKVRIYRLKDGENFTYEDFYKKEEEMLSKFTDVAPEGWAFCPSEMQSRNNQSAVVSLYKTAYTVNYELNVNFEGNGNEITEDDNYIAVVEVAHSTGGNTYFITGITGSGDNVVTYPVTEWLDSNGHLKKDEKLTGHEESRTIYLYKLKDGFPMPDKAQIINKGSMLTAIEKGTAVGAYSYQGYTSDSVNDDVNYITTISDTINLKAIQTSSDYNYLNILQNSVNYGVTADSIELCGHSQTNVATNLYKAATNIDSNLSGPLDKNLHEKFSGSSAGIFLAAEIDGKLTIGNETYGNPVIITSSTPLSDYIVDDTHNHDKVIAVNAEKSTITGTVNGMIADMKQVSSDMADHSATLSPSVADGKVLIDTLGFEDDATIYIDGDAIINQIQNGGITIKKHKDQIIVFNILSPQNSHLTSINEIIVDYGDGAHTTNTIWSDANDPQNDYADQISRQIVWNLASVTQLDGTTRAGGMFLLPQSESVAHFGGASCGWIISAGNVKLGSGGELHIVYRDLNPNSRANLSLKKKVDGKTPVENQVFTLHLNHMILIQKHLIPLKPMMMILPLLIIQ